MLERDDKVRLNNPGSDAIMQEYGGKNAGLPFFGFIDPAGKLLGNAKNSDGNNIGHPYEPNEIVHFMKLLEIAAPAMTPEERNQIRTWLSRQKTQGKK